jgi:hypothetical protein
MQNKRAERLAELQKLLNVFPGDVLARCELAVLQEELDLHDDALTNWKAVLDFDPNHLKAREGVNRCRWRSGRPF